MQHIWDHHHKNKSQVDVQTLNFLVHEPHDFSHPQICPEAGATIQLHTLSSLSLSLSFISLSVSKYSFTPSTLSVTYG